MTSANQTVLHDNSLLFKNVAVVTFFSLNARAAAVGCHDNSDVYRLHDLVFLFL